MHNARLCTMQTFRYSFWSSKDSCVRHILQQTGRNCFWVIHLSACISNFHIHRLHHSIPCSTSLSDKAKVTPPRPPNSNSPCSSACCTHPPLSVAQAILYQVTNHKVYVPVSQASLRAIQCAHINRPMLEF